MVIKLIINLYISFYYSIYHYSIIFSLYCKHIFTGTSSSIPPYLSQYPPPSTGIPQRNIAVAQVYPPTVTKPFPPTVTSTLTSRPGTSVIAPSMLSYAAERKEIPSLNNINNNNNNNNGGKGIIDDDSIYKCFDMI